MACAEVFDTPLAGKSGFDFSLRLAAVIRATPAAPSYRLLPRAENMRTLAFDPVAEHTQHFFSEAALHARAR